MVTSETETNQPVIYPSTSGAKLTGLKTAKPVHEPKYDNEIETNKRMEDLLKHVKGLNDYFKVLIEMEKRKYPNFFQDYTLTNTSQSRLHFEFDTNQSPILEINIAMVGGGLQLSLNGSSMFYVGAGDKFTGEFRTIDYQVTSGTAIIILQARVDK